MVISVIGCRMECPRPWSATSSSRSKMCQQRRSETFTINSRVRIIYPAQVVKTVLMNYFSSTSDSWSKAAAKLDMERMRTVVKRRILRALSDAENDPHSSIAGMALGDHLFGNNLDDVSFPKSSCYDRVVRNKLFDSKTFHGSFICSSSFRCSVLVYTLMVRASIMFVYKLHLKSRMVD